MTYKQGGSVASKPEPEVTDIKAMMVNNFKDALTKTCFPNVLAASDRTENNESGKPEPGHEAGTSEKPETVHEEDGSTEPEVDHELGESGEPEIEHTNENSV